jgi:hypothetical protein
MPFDETSFDKRHLKKRHSKFWREAIQGQHSQHLIFLYLADEHDKLECFALAGLSNLV